MTKSIEDEARLPIVESSLGKTLKALAEEDASAFLSFLIRSVTPDEIIGDRYAQTVIDSVMFHDRGRRLKISESKNGGNSTHFIVPFGLKDSTHHYYFHTGRPIEDVPINLRPDDIIIPSLLLLGEPKRHKGSSINHRNPRFAESPTPFNKPLHRVSVAGGPEQTFNYHTSSWENGNARWKKGDWSIPRPTYFIDTVFAA